MGPAQWDPIGGIKGLEVDDGSRTVVPHHRRGDRGGKHTDDRPPRHGRFGRTAPEDQADQMFEGLVNGKRSVPDAVTVFVSCHGPAQKTGHPLGTVEVLPAPSTAANEGNTGDSGTSIVAFFGAPPPAAHTASLATAAGTTTVTFHRYGVVKSMPTGVEVPCSGTGQVTFIAFPRTPPTSRAAVVPVHYLPEP